MVKNTRKLLNTLKIDEGKFVKEANNLLMEDYTEFDDKMINLISEKSKYASWQIKEVFGHLENNYMFNWKLKIFNKGR
jgi:hypothetical protein